MNKITNYERVAMKILEEIKRECPETTFSEIEKILDETRDWAKKLTIQWKVEY